MNFFHFFLTSILIILLPGTGVIYTISTGLCSGRKASLYAALGCTLGILPHLFVSIMLSSLLLAMNDTAFLILRLLGAAYLCYLGIGMLFSKNAIVLEPQTEEKQILHILRRGIWINLLNPKLTLFFFAFLPQYVSSTNHSYLLQSWIYGLAFMLLTLIVFAVYGICAGILQTRLSRKPQSFQYLGRLFGLIFLLFAVQLAFQSL